MLPGEAARLLPRDGCGDSLQAEKILSLARRFPACAFGQAIKTFFPENGKKIPALTNGASGSSARFGRIPFRPRPLKSFAAFGCPAAGRGNVLLDLPAGSLYGRKEPGGGYAANPARSERKQR